MVKNMENVGYCKVNCCYYSPGCFPSTLLVCPTTVLQQAMNSGQWLCWKWKCLALLKEAVRSWKAYCASKTAGHFLPPPWSPHPLFLCDAQIKAFLPCLPSKALHICGLTVEGHQPPSFCTLSSSCLGAAKAPAGVGEAAASIQSVLPADVKSLVQWSGCTCWFTTIC